MDMIARGIGEHGVLMGNLMALFPSRMQALAYARWLFSLGLSPSYWMQADRDA